MKSFYHDLIAFSIQANLAREIASNIKHEASIAMERKLVNHAERAVKNMTLFIQQIKSSMSPENAKRFEEQITKDSHLDFLEVAETMFYCSSDQTDKIVQLIRALRQGKSVTFTIHDKNETYAQAIP
jgi:ATP phosphoribosyltransferase